MKLGRWGLTDLPGMWNLFISGGEIISKPVMRMVLILI